MKRLSVHGDLLEVLDRVVAFEVTLPLGSPPEMSRGRSTKETDDQTEQICEEQIIGILCDHDA